MRGNFAYLSTQTPDKLVNQPGPRTKTQGEAGIRIVSTLPLSS